MVCPRTAVKEEELTAIDESKTTFLLFATLSFVVIVAGAALLFFLVKPRLAALGPHFLLIFTLAGGVVLLVLVLSLAFLIVSAITEKNYSFFRRGRYLVLGVLVPISIWLGRRMGIPKDCMRNSFIKVSNSLARSAVNLISAKRLLILLPHCLQRSNCICKICADIENCKRCRQCVIYEFVSLTEKYKFKAFVANGGEMARRLVAEARPTAIIAIACERELASGIQDTYHIPVIGIPNIRPYGPCKDTQVDFKMVEETVKYIMGR